MYALVDPSTEVAAALRLIVEPTASMPAGTLHSRAFAAWGLIIHEIEKFGPSENSRGRNALRAAFRLPRRQEITEPWAPTLGGRFLQLRANLGSVFGNPATTTPIHKAWTDALTKRLVPILTTQLSMLAEDGSGWAFYADVARHMESEFYAEQVTEIDPSATRRPLDTGQLVTFEVEAERGGSDAQRDRSSETAPVSKVKSTSGRARSQAQQPSTRTQPLFIDLMITTVIMKRRTAHRRITERLVTARIDGLKSYVAVASAGFIGLSPEVRAVWGCRAVRLTPRKHGEPVLTRLVFPRSLRMNEKHFFSSEAIDNKLVAEREGVDVEIDHHGIAPGRLIDGVLPVSGLTIRIQFDEGHVPRGCWWHAEQTLGERRALPPKGSDRWLPISGRSIAHTFIERCQPREVYGISFQWD
ncbi:hypothetical protein [Kribbella sp. NPDC023855]|uniref:hypothetical protein n=1 Tax=Kribbella sp. NPDC023855 TaxID=3154698 RepID=UPI0033EC6D4C